MFNLFLDTGILVNAQSDDGSTVLFSCLNSYRTHGYFHLLLEKGASLTIGMKDGTLPIHKICENCHVEALKAIIQVNGNDAIYLNARTSLGKTPLQLLTSRDIYDVSNMIEILTSQTEVDVKCLNERHETPLIEVAKSFGRTCNVYYDSDSVFRLRLIKDKLVSMRCLLTRGVNSNAMCQVSRTALHYIFSYPSTPATIEAAQLLLERGAKLNIKENSGETVVDLVFNV